MKDEQRTFRQKYIVYESYQVAEDDPLIAKYIEDAKRNFDGDPEIIQIKIHMEIQ